MIRTDLDTVGYRKENAVARSPDRLRFLKIYSAPKSKLWLLNPTLSNCYMVHMTAARVVSCRRDPSCKEPQSGLMSDNGCIAPCPSRYLLDEEQEQVVTTVR